MTQVIVVHKKEPDAEDDPPPYPSKLLFRPLIPIGHESLLPAHPQISAPDVAALGHLLEAHLRVRAEPVAKEQQNITDNVRELDFATTFLCNAVVGERQKRVSKVIDNFKKLPDIEKLVAKCEGDLKTCLQKIDALNVLLPPNLRLEKLDLTAAEKL